ncbi:hypothetical protein HO173_011760 [Letharia columbiana]|uniref:Uncharacterized protein n=1 Tax=Letharia columbiana TaxID=112416 RepID=A0A8H6FHU5_9LECA|nr:uncharacterized protein HO173_012343 [Letharia columbiana]XP_037159556.1 uncharacterized protein HO173_011760 [Letharia columbiana]KAF6226740.1 hypothetical protein HO173_012343 [Letharia columbiana]KAF6228741.1 hypothetical protein HO173_011760 [Letharia columbiana]
MHPLLSLLFLPPITLLVTASNIPNILLTPSLSPAPDLHPTTSNLPLSPPHNNTTTTKTDTPSFLNTVTSAVLKTIAKHPTATFRFVRASSPTGPTASLPSLTRVRIVFSIRDGPTHHAFRSLHVDMTPVWSVWDPPVLSPDDVPADMGAMHLDVRLDLDEAWRLAREWGFYRLCEGVLLYWPSSPPAPTAQQPFYRFQGLGPGLGFVYVGAWTRVVTTDLDGVGVGRNGSAAGAVDVV